MSTLPTKPSILLAGAGGHARSCIDVIEQEGRFVIAGLVGLPDEVGTQILGYPVIGSDSDLLALASDSSYALVTVGQIKTPELRISFFEQLEQGDCKIPAVISPRAYVSPHAVIGDGTIIMHGAIVNAGARIGRNCIINSHALVEHDVVIDDHCHIATRATLNGGVFVGAGTFIGSGSVVRQSIKIGKRCVVGMGQRVLTDCENGTLIPLPKTSS